MKLQVLALIASSTLVVNSLAQNQVPSSVDWMEVKTPHFKLIAPSQIQDKAVETANLLEHVYQPVSSTLCYPSKRLPVVLMNQSVISNGSVSLAPTHSVFYTTPMQDANLIGGMEWMQALAIHEYRHYVQFEKLNDHFTNWAKTIFGEQGQGVLTIWSTPMWMFEGDAIWSETVYSAGGRGRLPAFSTPERAMELENIRYSYDKAYLGSYRDFVPNHYYLGYTLCSGLKAAYGLETWDQIMTRSSRFSFWPYAFTRSIKKYTGVRFSRNYQMVLSTYNSIWAKNARQQEITKFETFNHPRKGYTHYQYPFECADGSILCLKYGLDDIATLCRLQNGREEELTGLDPVDRIHSNGEQVVWSTVTSDIRWGERSYSDIVIYDPKTNQQRKLTHKQKYFAPALSPQGDRIVAVEYTETMQCNLVMLDARNGTLLQQIPVPDNAFARMPSWSENGSQVVFAQTRGQEMNLTLWEPGNGSFRSLLPWRTRVISSPVFFGSYVVYNASYEGVDALFAIQPDTQKEYRVAAGKYGIYNASVYLGQMAFQDYTTQGYSIARIKINAADWKEITVADPTNGPMVDALVAQQRYGNLFADSTEITDRSATYQIRNYHPLLKAIHVHSWSPSLVPNGIGYKVHSNDFLNTTSLTAGLNYFPRDEATSEYVNLEYARYFPVIQLTGALGQSYANGLYPNTRDTLYGFQEQSWGAGVTLPFNFSSGVYDNRLKVGASYLSIYQKMDAPADSMRDSYRFDGLNLELDAHRLLQQAPRDLYSRFGQALRVGSWLTPDKNYLLAAEGQLYFPGILKHHSLQLQGGYEARSLDFQTGVYSLPTEIAFVKGYGKIASKQKYHASIAYTLPLGYPDIRLGPVLYIPQIHGTLFADYGQAQGYQWESFSSVGVDLNFEFNAFRLLPRFEMGLRYAYRIELGSSSLEFLLFRTPL